MQEKAEYKPAGSPCGCRCEGVVSCMEGIVKCSEENIDAVLSYLTHVLYVNEGWFYRCLFAVVHPSIC